MRILCFFLRSSAPHSELYEPEALAELRFRHATVNETHGQYQAEPSSHALEEAQKVASPIRMRQGEDLSLPLMLRFGVR